MNEMPRRARWSRFLLQVVLGSVVSISACSIPSDTSTAADGNHPNAPTLLTIGDMIGYWAYDEIYVPGGLITDEELAMISCPHHDGIRRPVELGVQVGNPPNDHIAHFVFAWFKPFIAYSPERLRWGGGFLPVGYFGPVPETLSEADGRYVAYGTLSIACNGRYYRLPGGRLWTGTYLVLRVQHVRESGLYPPTDGDGPCDSYQIIYDPLAPGPECEGNPGGGGTMVRRAPPSG
jgi:hypothetical protein